MKLRKPNTRPSVELWPSDIGSLAFKLDEFFDALDMLYEEGDGKSSSKAGNKRRNCFDGQDVVVG
jgi:hypothetical protein